MNQGKAKNRRAGRHQTLPARRSGKAICHVGRQSLEQMQHSEPGADAGDGRDVPKYQSDSALELSLYNWYS